MVPSFVSCHFSCFFTFFPLFFVAQSPLSRSVSQQLLTGIEEELATQGLKLGSPMFLRIFKIGDQEFVDADVQYRAGLSKRPQVRWVAGPEAGFSSPTNVIGNRPNDQTAKLEIWFQPEPQKPYVLYKRYTVCTYSGKLGPKRKEGDMQSPEGFYNVVPSAFNPSSSYRLSFNVGYPNTYDRAKRYTGGSVMVHGICGSVGCFAMSGDIDEIYTIVSTAAMRGQSSIPLHIFPFSMTDENIQSYKPFMPPEDIEFWTTQLQPGWKLFHDSGIPPVVAVQAGGYSFLPVAFGAAPPTIIRGN